MRLVVKKFGGTSVGTLDRIREVAKKVAAARDQGEGIVVVVSAMAGETDRLVQLGYQVSDNPNEREFDLLLSTGEMVSSALLAIALNAMGYAAESLTGRQVGILTDSVHTKARIRKINGERILQTLEQGKIAVVAGFQGIDEREDMTTLGRGGSDTTAVALAAALGADLCEIYTDVDGVYTADPNVVPEARRLRKISYDEMLEMASLGAKVLQTRSVEVAKIYNVSVLVKSTFQEGEGTLVTHEDAELEKVVVSGVTLDKNQARLTVAGVPDRPGVAAKIFGKVSDAHIIVDMIVQNVGEQELTDISFTVARSDAKKALTLVQEVLPEIGAHDVKLDAKIAKVSIIGAGMRSHSGIATTMFAALARENVNILMISTSEIKISCVIDEKYAELAVRTLHEAFDLGNRRDEEAAER
ncbi:MAG TPA: aspartate kinase [Alphaproteobacteria bacterium]|nr:aspartate kinase [Alphaproteobacteria bacterium]